jgi:MerR family transcriptional regulator, light-induced transcriptional regulator
VSESSLKRWCDAGHLTFSRTAGGHRRVRTAAVLAFAKTHGHRVVAPEELGLVSLDGAPSEPSLRSRFTRLLIAGRAHGVTELLSALFASGTSVADLCDELIAPTLADLGEAWAGGGLEIYEERRACELIGRAVADLADLAPRSGVRAPRAIGGALTGDPYTLPTLMAEATLRHQGVDARSLGAFLPAPTIVAAIREIKPKIVWLTVGHVPDQDALIDDVRHIESAAAGVGGALAIGGRALASQLRVELPCAVFCDRMQQLASFGRALAS